MSKIKKEEAKLLGFETYRADITDVSEDTFSVVIATDRAVRMEGYRYADNFEVFDEVLRCEPDAIRTDRMDIGLPLFPSHWERDATDIVGVSTGYDIGDGKITATFKLGARADEAMRADIANGILRSVSIGANIYAVERDASSSVIRYEAIDWEPKHVAFAPEPADVNCTIRSQAKVISDEETNPEKPEIIEQENDILKNLLTRKK